MMRPTVSPRWLWLALLLCVPPLAAAPAAYRIDPVHTRILFRVGHNGFSSAMGTFSRPEGTLWFDSEDWTTARLDVKISLQTLDLGDADFDARIRRRAWLDVGTHPDARFVSTSIEPVDRTHARVHGILTLRGTSEPVTLEVRLNRHARTAYNSMRRTAGFSASATLSRAAFGMKAHPRAVDDAVHLMIEAEAIRIPKDE